MRVTTEVNQIKCLVGEPCIYCQPLQCPRTFFNREFVPDHSCSDESFFRKDSITFAIFLLLVGFVLGILYQRRYDRTASRSNQVPNINYPAPVTICELGVQTVSDKTIRSQFSDLSEDLLFSAPPPSIADAADKEECENSEQEEEEQETTAKLRWRDVRMTRRGSLFATRLGRLCLV
jgi:hypothetical protein